MNTEENQPGEDPANLAWALGYLGRQQSVSLDPLRLQAALKQTSFERRLANKLDLICQGLGAELDKRKRLHLDPTRLPVLCHLPDHGWGVVETLSPNGRWKTKFFEQNVELTEDELIKQVFDVRLASKAIESGAKTFKEVFKKSLKTYRGTVYEGVFATIFTGFLGLAISLFSMQVYDRVIPTRSESTLITLAVGVALAIFLEFAMKLARSRMMDAVIAGLDRVVSREIFQRLMNVRVDQLPGSVGSLAAQLRGYEQVRSFYTANTLYTLVDVPLGIVFLVIIAAIAAPIVSAVPLIFGVMAIFIGLASKRRIEKLANESAGASNQKTGLLVEAVEGAETIKAGSGSWKFLSRWLDINKQTVRNEMEMRHASESLSYISAVLQQLSYATLIAVGAWVVMQGTMTTGALIACSILSGRIMAPILGLPALMVQHAHAKAAQKGLEQLYALKTDNDGVGRPLVPSSIDGAFNLDKVKFSYAHSPVAIDIKKLEIKPGEKVAILGPIGSGKSTLLRILAGLYQPQEGKVLVDGLEMAQISRPAISQHIGYLQQDHRLFQGTLRDNLLIGLSDPGDDHLKRIMTRSGLMKLVSAHPKGLELPIMEGGKGLSGGQRQLVAFTRLLLGNSQVLLLDEPTANMDDEQERRCLAVLKEECNAGKTVIIVTHKPSLLPLVQRLIIISGNELVMDGPRDAVIARLQQGSRPNAATPGAPSGVQTSTPTSTTSNGPASAKTNAQYGAPFTAAPQSATPVITVNLNSANANQQEPGQTETHEQAKAEAL